MRKPNKNTVKLLTFLAEASDHAGIFHLRNVLRILNNSEAQPNTTYNSKIVNLTRSGYFARLERGVYYTTKKTLLTIGWQ
jgi:predicted transcriptional regulator of viral defense system